MKDYFEDDAETTPQWMPLFISLMLVLLTLFIFLTTFAAGDRRKVERFREYFRESLLLSGGKGVDGAPSIADVGTGVDPLKSLVNRMKSEGINKKLMDDFLTLNQIKELEVMDGRRGVAIILPETVGFVPGKNQLKRFAEDYLEDISYLVSELPYLVEIRGYSTSQVPIGYADALEFSARRALLVYDYFVNRNIAPVKLKVSGCGDAFEGSGVAQDKVEIIFKSAEL